MRNACAAVPRLVFKPQLHCLLAARHGLNHAHQILMLKFLPLVPGETTGFGAWSLKEVRLKQGHIGEPSPVD